MIIATEFAAMSRSLSRMQRAAKMLRQEARLEHVAIVFGYRIDDLAAHMVRTNTWFAANVAVDE